MSTDRNDANIAQQMYDTYQPAGVTIASCGVSPNCAPEVRDHAVLLSQEISHIGDSLKSMASKAIPAGMVAAVTAAAAQVDLGTAGIVAFAAGAAGTLSAMNAPRGKAEKGEGHSL